MLGRLSLIALGTLIALGLVEVTMRVGYERLPGRLQDRLQHVRIWGVAGDALGPHWTLYCVGDDELGVRVLPGLDRQRVRFGPYVYRVSTESLGFDRVGFRSGGARKPFNAVVVGDSFGFCHHVDYSDCWVGHVARETGLKIANLAIPATGSVSHSRYLERYGRRLDPDVVIWQYWVNDPADDVDLVIGGYVGCPRTPVPASKSRERGSYLRYGSIAVNLLYRTAVSNPTVDTEARRTYRFETSRGRTLFAWRPHPNGAPPDLVETTGFEMTTSAIALGARRTRNAGRRFILLIAPSNLQVHEEYLPSESLRNAARAEQRMTDRLVAFARDQGIETLDLRPAFAAAAERGAVLYPDSDVHWTRAGNALAAQLVVTALTSPRGSAASR